MIVFDEKEWIKNPNAYPMVRNCKTSPLIPYRPVLKHHFFAVPLDIYEQIVYEVE